MDFKKLVVFLLGILISIASIYLIVKNIDVSSSIKTLNKIPLVVPILLMGIYLLGFWLRAFRWKLMINHYQQFSINQLLQAVVVGYAGNNFLPARGGEFLRMEFFSRTAKIPRTVSLTSVLAEKIFDGLSLLFILIVVVIAFPSSLLEVTWFKTLFYSANLIFIGVLFGLVLLKSLEQKVMGFISGKLGIWQKLATLIGDILHAIDFVKPNLNGLLILLSGVLVWVVEGSMFALGAYFLLPDANPFMVGYLTLVVVNFGILIPSSPGYVGVFQGMTILAFSLLQIPEEQALVHAILIHACQFIPITLWGTVIITKKAIKLKF